MKRSDRKEEDDAHNRTEPLPELGLGLNDEARKPKRVRGSLSDLFAIVPGTGLSSLTEQQQTAGPATATTSATRTSFKDLVDAARGVAKGSSHVAAVKWDPIPTTVGRGDASAAVIAGESSLNGDWSIKRAVTITTTVPSGKSSADWAMVTPADESAAIEGVGVSELPSAAAPAAKLLHALQYFEFRCPRPGVALTQRDRQELTDALRSLRALVDCGRVPCFYVIGAAFSIVFRRGRALVHPPSAAKVLLLCQDSVAGDEPETNPDAMAKSVPKSAAEEELEELERSAHGMLTIRRAGDKPSDGAADASATDFSSPAAAIDGAKEVTRLCTRLCEFPSLMHGAIVLSQRAFVGGTLRRGKLRAFTAGRSSVASISGSSGDIVGVVEITDALLTHDALRKVLDAASSAWEALPFRATFDTERVTVSLGAQSLLMADLPPTTYVSSALWNPDSKHLSFTIAKMH